MKTSGAPSLARPFALEVRDFRPSEVEGISRQVTLDEKPAQAIRDPRPAGEGAGHRDDAFEKGLTFQTAPLPFNQRFRAHGVFILH
jgi:hypothetical protein